jgi:energy-coupling factor transporter ATP-binding protein EcfA2
MATNSPDDNHFEERAERLTPEELIGWTYLTPADRNVIRKLRGPGVKLVVGPRGSGKTTLLKIALYELNASRDVLGIYANFSHSLALEPLFFSHSGALKLFRQWVVQKIVIGVAETLATWEIEPDIRLSQQCDFARHFVASLEKGVVLSDETQYLAPSELVAIIESVCDECGVGRSTLLLDDAAHAFSTEQQREFFEIFRQLRTRRIAPKAAVYPGITSYSHSFNVAHEAELLYVWYNPSDDDYLHNMRSIAKKRLPDLVLQSLGSSADEYLNILSLAAFGQPRALLNMISAVVDSASAGKPVTRTLVLKAVEDYNQYMLGVFRSLGVKLPRYKQFIDFGEEINESITSRISEYNRNRAVGEKGLAIGISAPLSEKLERILRFFEYAGMVRPLSDHSRGSKGVYKRYLVHYSSLIANNSLSLGQTYRNSDLITALIGFDQHNYYRATESGLVPPFFGANCVLDLPPCSNCQAPRLSEDQKFCASCGSKLTDASVYRSLLLTPIDKLPLTSTKIKGILKHTPLRTVQDILTDEEQRLKDVPYIDKYWAARIKNIAEEFVSV